MSESSQKKSKRRRETSRAQQGLGEAELSVRHGSACTTGGTQPWGGAAQCLSSAHLLGRVGREEAADAS